MKQFNSAYWSTHLHHTQNAMSTSIKQERTICVLLPNKDQLDVTVGVSAYSNTASSPLTFFQSYFFFAAVFPLTVNAFCSLLQPKSTGQDVFNRVEELLGVKELHFFGLTVVKGRPAAL